jgi:hypothetical protein
MSDTPWASDVRVSLPQPLAADNPVLVSMFGFGFTERGLFHNLSVADHEALSWPNFAPGYSPEDLVRGDREFQS